MSPTDWVGFQRDLVYLLQPILYWCMIGFLAGAVILSLIGAFVGFMDARFG